MKTYYNEIDPYCVQWLKNLIAAEHLPKGDVDDRDIRQVQPADLKGYTQAHFFAGLGGWPYALRLAGWPDDRPVWTGSCPCQPFSAAGKGRGKTDERHLWPDWFSLIRECKPATVFGEQVDAAIRWGWLDAVFADLEAEGYACGASVLPACSVGGPHIRQRLWFVAISWTNSNLGELAHADIARCGAGGPREASDGRDATWIEPSGFCHDSMGNANQQGSQGWGIDTGEYSGECPIGPPSAWDNLVWLPCTDGKQRPTQSGIFPLAHGIPARVAKLRAIGNAIIPQVAAEFIKAAIMLDRQDQISVDNTTDIPQSETAPNV